MTKNNKSNPSKNNICKGVTEDVKKSLEKYVSHPAEGMGERRKAWDVNIKKALAQHEWTQEDLRHRLKPNEKGDRPTQSTVNRWCNVSKGRNRRFPPYERMCEIAGILGKSVAWLTGEIEGDYYDNQLVMDYLNLPEQGVRAIARMTGGPGAGGGEAAGLFERVSSDSVKYRIYPIALSRLFTTRTFTYQLAEAVVEYLRDYAVQRKSDTIFEALVRSQEVQTRHELHKFNLLQLMDKALDEMTEGISLPNIAEFESPRAKEINEIMKARREAEEREFCEKHVMPSDEELKAEMEEDKAAERGFQKLERAWDEAVRIPLSGKEDDPFGVVMAEGAVTD